MRILYALLTVAILFFVGPKVALLFSVWLLGFGVSVLPLAIPEKFRRAVTVVCLLQFLAVNLALRMHPMKMLTADATLGVSFAILLYTLVSARQPIRSMAYQHLATRFSKFSYTLYLVHLPFLTLMTALIIRPWHPWAKGPRHYAAAVLLVAAAYLYAWVLYLAFERNTDALRKRIAPFFERAPRALA